MFPGHTLLEAIYATPGSPLFNSHRVLGDWLPHNESKKAYLVSQETQCIQEYPNSNPQGRVIMRVSSAKELFTPVTKVAPKSHP